MPLVGGETPGEPYQPTGGDPNPGQQGLAPDSQFVVKGKARKALLNVKGGKK